MVTLARVFMNSTRLIVDDRYVQGNPVRDWNVSSSVFELIEGLDELVADTPDKSAYGCPQGQWKTAHDVSFCVANDGGSTASASTGSS